MCRPRFSPECVQTALHSGAGGRSREAPPAPPSRAAPSRPSRCNAPPTGETTRGRGETPRPPSSRRACFALARRGTAHGGETSRWVGSSGAHVVRKARRRGSGDIDLDGRPGRLLRSAARAAEEEEKPRRTREDRHERKNGASQRGAGPTQLERAPYDPAAARQM
ncbi:unnamed protein product [Prorocentrum cordatum]|uniref:Peptidyl-prolyl cis-trans isomerase n=1 Tax=Prorocentrum cordatum TaxID=2364126 RepID=A0ABN9U0N1_9DINO|nr:unnamed protein product [Polarella glacialis]